MNDAGDIVGCTQDAADVDRAVWWTGPTHTLHELSGELTGGACLDGVDDAGLAVGYWYRGAVRVAAMWNLATGARTDIADNADANGIDHDGLVIGTHLGADGRNHAYSWRAGTAPVDLAHSAGAPAGTASSATAVNASGAAVGTELTPDTHQHAVSY